MPHNLACLALALQTPSFPGISSIPFEHLQTLCLCPGCYFIAEYPFYANAASQYSTNSSSHQFKHSAMIYHQNHTIIFIPSAPTMTLPNQPQGYGLFVASKKLNCRAFTLFLLGTLRVPFRLRLPSLAYIFLASSRNSAVLRAVDMRNRAAWTAAL